MSRKKILVTENDEEIPDLMLPGLDGLEVCRKLGNDPEGGNLPIIMLTAKGEESDIITGLELGADDHVATRITEDVVCMVEDGIIRHQAGSRFKNPGSTDQRRR